MKLITKYGFILLMPVMIVSCATPQPLTPEQREQQMRELDLYMLSHGQMVPMSF